jgi:hypothetical protein
MSDIILFERLLVPGSCQTSCHACRKPHDRAIDSSMRNIMSPVMDDSDISPFAVALCQTGKAAGFQPGWDYARNCGAFQDKSGTPSIQKLHSGIGALMTGSAQRSIGLRPMSRSAHALAFPRQRASALTTKAYFQSIRPANRPRDSPVVSIAPPPGSAIGRDLDGTNKHAGFLSRRTRFSRIFTSAYV